MIININGELLSKNDAKISVFDRGFLFGDSVYDVTITFNGKPFLLDEHLKRLKHSSDLMGLKMTISLEEIKKQIRKTIEASEIHYGNLRIIVTRGIGELNLDPTQPLENNLIIIYRNQPEIPQELYEKGVSVIIADIQRNSKESVDPNIKSGNYLNNVMALGEARERNAFEAIMLNQNGFITEATTSNIWIIKDNLIKTPPLKAGLLGGITRKYLIKMAKESGFSVSEENFRPEELMNADECFLTSTSRRILPVTQVEEITLSGGHTGENTAKLIKIYDDFIASWQKSFSW